MDNKITKRTYKLSKDQRDQVLDLIREGTLTYQAIGDKFGVTRSTVYQYAQSRGIIRLRSNARYVTEDEVHELVNTAVAKALATAQGRNQ